MTTPPNPTSGDRAVLAAGLALAVLLAPANEACTPVPRPMPIERARGCRRDPAEPIPITPRRKARPKNYRRSSGAAPGMPPGAPHSTRSPMNPPSIVLVRESFAQVHPSQRRRPPCSMNLFAADPSLRALFRGKHGAAGRSA